MFGIDVVAGLGGFVERTFAGAPDVCLVEVGSHDGGRDSRSGVWEAVWWLACRVPSGILLGLHNAGAGTCIGSAQCVKGPGVLGCSVAMGR